MKNNHFFIFSGGALAVALIGLTYSWTVFWVSSVSVLLLSLFRGDEYIESSGGDVDAGKFHYLIVYGLTLAAIVLSYAVNRSDLDDASYVAIASFLSAQPQHAILSSDPMLGELSFPLVLSSLRYTTFELLSGAIAYLLSTPALNVYYIYILPVWVILTVISTFLLSRELIPRHWLLTGVIVFLLTLLLGEMHRAPANFSFVRIFQGKAVFLSVIVPSIYYLTARFFSERGSKGDLLLLACCQIASVGMSSFGMLMGPVAGFGALLSNIPSALKGDLKKVYFAIAVLLVPLPYLLSVALEFNSSPLMNLEVETASGVWKSVFGHHQQYLLGFLMLAGPVLAKDRVTRWRLAVSPLILLAVYLNPLFSEFISRYVTSPPVYWRVVWSFPILIYAGVSCSLILSGLAERRKRLISVAFLAVTICLTIYSLPFHTLRGGNIDSFQDFASWKVPREHLAIARKAIDINPDGGRLLAPDEISGVISRFENRPRLISARGMYIELFQPLVGEAESAPRQLLYDFVVGNSAPQVEKVRAAIRLLDVSVIVFRAETVTSNVLEILELEGFERRESKLGYTIWVRGTL